MYIHSVFVFCISTFLWHNMWPFTANLGLFYHLSLSSCPNFRFIGRRRANSALKLLRSIKFFSTLSIGFLTTQALSTGKVIFVVILLSNPTHLITIITIATIIALIIIIIKMVIGILRMRPGLARSSQLSSFSRQPLEWHTAHCYTTDNCTISHTATHNRTANVQWTKQDYTGLQCRSAFKIVMH